MKWTDRYISGMGNSKNRKHSQNFANDQMDQEAKLARHPIGVVAARTGLRPDILRAWERRYGAVVPQRAPKGRRLYTDQDVARLRLLRQLVAAGRRISDVARLPREELETLAREDAAAAGVETYAPRAAAGAGSAQSYLEEMLGAIESLDWQRLEKALSSAAVALSGPLLRREVIVPLLHSVGERWREGSLRIVHEHLASAVVRSYLAALRNGNHIPPGAPKVIVTTLAGQRHELGALLVASTATDGGWDAIYLGPDLPTEEIVAAVQQRGARAVALSLIYPLGDPGTAEELRRLRRFVGQEVGILVGGRAAASYDAVLREVGAVHLGDLAELPRELEAISG
jgi:DNA-binding transcriptional MerR regulator/methylmalonyl-CoA mutase cobalamin-binding subunit